MSKEELNDLLELIEAGIDNRESRDCAEAVRFAELKKEFIANWCN